MAQIDGLVLVAALAWLVGFGWASAWFAIRRRRNPVVWAALGAVLGPVALLILRVAPPGRCWGCTTPTRGWLTICGWCGEDVRGPQEIDFAPANEPASLTVIDGAGGGASAPRSARSVRPSIPARGGGPPVTQTPASGASVVAETMPIRRRRTASTSAAGRAATAAAASREPEQAPETVEEELREVILASAIYFTGSKALLPGSRYGIAIFGHTLRILGPVDVDPRAVVLERSLRGMDATGSQDRLVITATGRRDFTLIFMSVAGGPADRVADRIVAAARSPRGAQA